MKEPTWITDREAVILNEILVATFGGLAGGVRDGNLLRAALARPLNKWHYEDLRPDLADLAAGYAFAIARGHVFIGGNKRTAHAIAAVFLDNNGMTHAPTEADVVAVMTGLADGRISEAELGAWFRETSPPRKAG